MMLYVQALILSIVQSLTEFLPVSSSGHLILFHHFLNDSSILNNVSFDVFLHAGSLFAIILYFFKDIKSIIVNLFSKKSKNNLFIYVIVGIIPAAIVGYLFSDFINTLRSNYIVVISLIFGALLFVFAEKFYKNKKDLENINFFDSIFIGTLQCLSLIPGISRSGITISTAMIRGFNRVDSARFSFLMAIPLIFGAFIKQTTDMEISVAQINLYVFGFITSFVFSLFSIFIFIKILKKYKLYVFAYYRIILALMVLMLMNLGKI